jgi:hypothetical protein
VAVIAYLNYNRWVADCSNCMNAMLLERDQITFTCSSTSGVGACGYSTTITWPADPDAIEASVEGNAEQYQDWEPA